jgi:hypothetical protein
MTTQNSLFRIEKEDGDIVFLRYKTPEEAGKTAPTFKSRILQWFGTIIMLALGAAAFAPNAFHLSAGFRPWVFVTFIMWAVAFCAGMFSS